MRPVVLRRGVEIADPLALALEFLDAYATDAGDVAGTSSFDEEDLRRANRGGARISAAEIGAILERRREIELRLHEIAPDASLVGASVPWAPLTLLFDAFADIRGIGFSKMTKALHAKRPALIPMLDRVVEAYLAADDPGKGPPATFGERAIALVRAYKRDLDRNRSSLREIQRQLARHNHTLTEVRILDLLIWSTATAAR
jgi:hypothetical protein